MKQLLALGVVLLTACGPPVPEPVAAELAAFSVSFEPSSSSTQVANVVHVHVAGAALGTEGVAFYQGVLSSYYLGKIKQREVPAALAARVVPSVSWRSGQELIAAPTVPLELGQYSLVSPLGLITEFQVTSELPLLGRLWPPTGSGGSSLAIYCRPSAEGAALPEGASLLLAPRQLSVELLPGVGDGGAFGDRCLHFRFEALLGAGEISIPPPLLGDWALSPAVFGGGVELPVAPLICAPGEGTLTPGCATVADDRIVVRTPTAALLWLVHTAHGSLLEVTREGAPLSIIGLQPGTSERISGSVRDIAGTVVAFDFTVSTAPAQARVILNEALADALGPEPQSEWVELFNDGTLAATLDEYVLQDGGGSTALPHVQLGPKEYALLVREDFAPNGSDEPPAPSARLLRVPTLGKSGLTNSGERLALVDSRGVERSVLPALAGKSGQSLARRNPSARDDAEGAFAFGTPTPGTANVSAADTP